MLHLIDHEVCLLEVWLKKIKNSVVFICLFEINSLSLYYIKIDDMPKVLVSEFYQHGWKKPIRKYAIKGGLIPPFTMEHLGERYIMPGWYKLSKDEDMPNIEDIAFYPYKAKKPNIPNNMKNKVYKVTSSKGDKDYSVKMESSGSLSCTCPGYGFRRKCRHIDKIMNDAA